MDSSSAKGGKVARRPKDEHVSDGPSLIKNRKQNQKGVSLRLGLD
jgi:hypothetical protein